jgi:hypothetical protein
MWCQRSDRVYVTIKASRTRTAIGLPPALHAPSRSGVGLGRALAPRGCRRAPRLLLNRITALALCRRTPPFSRRSSWTLAAVRWPGAEHFIPCSQVADCTNARVDVSPDGRLNFEGYGHGARGTRAYALSVRLASSVTADHSRWFVCGPSVRVRLEKGKPGPYWPALLAQGDKLPQCKVDWQSWIDEDEETEVSSAPNG